MHKMIPIALQNPVFWRSLSLRKSFPMLGVRATSNLPVDYAQEKEQLLAKLKEDLPKPYDGPERDLVNFPRRERAIYPGKVRLGIFPDEWFTFFYKKTGVTGPYVFGVGFTTFLLSKELYVIEDEFSTGVAMFLLIYILIKKFGPAVRAFGEKTQQEYENGLNSKKEDNIKVLEDGIANEKKAQWQAGVMNILLAAKRENVMMQLETEYRRRLMTIYEGVKKRLDYHLETDNTRRKLEQKHMVDWIVDSVVKSITPQQEKEALQKCIADLKVLSAKAV